MLVNLSISPHSFINFSIIYFDVLLLSVYICKIMMSSWRIDPYIKLLFIFGKFSCSVACFV